MYDAASRGRGGTAPNTGLCAACDLSPSCVHARALSGPVAQCEQFQFELPPPAISDPHPSAAPRARRAAAPEGVAGLCASCALISSCTFPRPPQGAWFCEEYQ